MAKPISIQSKKGPGGTTRLTLPIQWHMEAAFLILMLAAYTLEGPLPGVLGGGAILLIAVGWAVGGVQQSLILNPAGRPLRMETRWFGVPHGSIDVVGTPTHIFVEASCFYGRAGLTWRYRPALLTTRGQILFLRPKTHSYDEVLKAAQSVAKWIDLPFHDAAPTEEFLGIEHLATGSPPVFEIRSEVEAEAHYRAAYNRTLKRVMLVAFGLGLLGAVSIPFLFP